VRVPSFERETLLLEELSAPIPNPVPCMFLEAENSTSGVTLLLASLRLDALLTGRGGTAGTSVGGVLLLDLLSDPLLFNKPVPKVNGIFVLDGLLPKMLEGFGERAFDEEGGENGSGEKGSCVFEGDLSAMGATDESLGRVALDNLRPTRPKKEPLCEVETEVDVAEASDG
jgi:hypothetical protein